MTVLRFEKREATARRGVKSLELNELAVVQEHCWRNIPISNNVGAVKRFSNAPRRALGEERHFALVGGLRFSNLGSLLIVGVRNSVRPIHLFDRNHDHDYLFELPSAKGAGYPIITSVIYCAPWRFPGAPALRTELFELTLIPTLTPHPVQMHRQFTRHRYLRDLPPSPHGEVEELAAPRRRTVHRDLRSFYQ